MFGNKRYGASGGRKWTPGFSLGYRVGFRRGWNGAHGNFGGRGGQSRYGGSRFAGRRFSARRS